MVREKCVNTEVIYDYILGKLDSGASEQARNHIESCPRCQARLNEVRQLLQVIQDDALLEVPAPVRQRNINLFRPWFETRQRELLSQPKPGLKQFLAQLITDTRRNPGLNAGLAGLRSTAFLNRDFQLLFSLDEGRIEVDLKVSPAHQEDHYNVLGQVVGLEGQICQVELVTPDSAILPADLDETFTFQYQNLAAGSYSLKITCGQESFEISPITL
ncbi:MAG: zf-HC2 domain-containing protein [Chloroflexi bacterium]|mgnify:CR=1 FL=1|nr:zf-HC2 domain-containing protein [Chloroflexota bacterium]OJV87049.1 MAG: hypothetical protein BGO39_33335 [Chloroflexi bacterium 54-19]